MKNNNFKLNINNVNDNVELKGWVNKTRRIGELVFFDLRKETDLVQIKVTPLEETSILKIANSLRNEFVVCVKGVVVERKSKNLNIFSGEIEIEAKNIEIINSSIQTPLLIQDKTDALEAKRLEYRYLDLRRKTNQIMLQKRSIFNKMIRDFFYENDFIEVETPIITKPSFGGANEFKLLRKNNKNNLYSLVQSPQIYKQLLMYSGIDKYFQIARCFRDEDSRSDRQLEFTQLDMEIAFSTKQDIILKINELLSEIVWKLLHKKIDENIKILSFDESIKRYGTDKPDIRFENEIFDLTKEFENSKIKFINDSIKNNKKIKALFFNKTLSTSEIKKMEEKLKSQGMQQFSWLKFNEDKVSGTLKSVEKEKLLSLKKKMNINENGLLLMVIDFEKDAFEYIGRIRSIVAKKLNLIDKNKLSFVWIIDFPLFEINSKGKIDSVHNPFTSFSFKNIESFLNFSSKQYDEILKIKSDSYDIVLNGVEIGGGATRISNPKIQQKVFEILGLKKEEIFNNFGWFLEAQNYGIPSHSGIALGLDRIFSILLNKNSIRDVIAFPKTSHGTDEMIKTK